MNTLPIILMLALLVSAPVSLWLYADADSGWGPEADQPVDLVLTPLGEALLDGQVR